MFEVSYAFIVLFQTFIIYIYFENALTPKKKTARFLLSFLAVWGITLGLSFLELPALNLIIFVVTTVFIACFNYRIKIRSGIFHAIILTLFMMGTEFLILIVSIPYLNISFDDHRYLIGQAVVSKLLFFATIYFTIKIRKNKREEDLESLFVLLSLSVAPISSIVFLMFVYNALSYQEDHFVTVGLSIGAILLMLSNMVVFFVYELTRQTHIKFTQLRLEQQRERISTEYYELLLEKHENHKILIHDINRHLCAIQTMANTATPAEIEQYATALCGEFDVNEIITYNGNKYVDVIINRYAQSCKSKGIEFQTEVQGISLDFMGDMDITALMDNLLENAMEAVLKADEKHICLSFHKENENFVVVNTQNSCNHEPRVCNGKILSSKKDKQAHGIGIKSIRRIAAKYNGNADWRYCNETAVFEMVVVLDSSISRAF